MSTPDNQSSGRALTLNQNGNPSSRSDDASAAEQPDGEADVAAQTHLEGRTKQMEKYFGYDKDRDKPSDVRTARLTVAILMATAAYQGNLSPPGGVWQDNNLNVNPKQLVGVSIMGTNNYFTFAWFMFGNTLGFYFSLYMIDFLTRGFPLRLELTFATFGMAVTYCTSMAAVAPNRPLSYGFNAFSFVLPISLPFIVPFLRDSKLACKIKKNIKGFCATRQPSM